MRNHQVIEHYCRLLVARDSEGMRRLVDPELVVDWPQSSERVRGVNNALAILSN